MQNALASSHVKEEINQQIIGVTILSMRMHVDHVFILYSYNLNGRSSKIVNAVDRTRLVLYVKSFTSCKQNFASKTFIFIRSRKLSGKNNRWEKYHERLRDYGSGYLRSIGTVNRVSLSHLLNGVGCDSRWSGQSLSWNKDKYPL